MDAAGTLPRDPAVLARFDQQIAGLAGILPVGKLRQKARSLVERLHPTPAVDRHQKAMAERTFWMQPGRDEMAWLGAHVSAEVAIKAQARIIATAKHLAGMPGETRTLAQLAADVCADLLTGAGTPTAVRATVSVTIPVLTLLGKDTPAGYRADPAILTGYGPIDPDTARRLCADAPSLFRLLTDPIDGATLTVGRNSYRPPADLKRLARAIHPTCTFPGCNRPAEHSDLDHTRDWLHHGPTALANIAPICRFHHRVKHLTRWRMTRDPDTAAITWTTPTGTTHNTDPPPY